MRYRVAIILLKYHFFSFFGFPFLFLFFYFTAWPTTRHPLPASRLPAARHQPPATRHPRKSPARNCYRLSVISFKSRNPFTSFPLTRPFSIVDTWVKEDSERTRKLSCSNFHDFRWNTIVPRCLSFVKLFQCTVLSCFCFGITSTLASSRTKM